MRIERSATDQDSDTVGRARSFRGEVDVILALEGSP